ncbi:MAG: T9SS type A sorting domain-containing protein [Bacteroidia bacterium]
MIKKNHYLSALLFTLLFSISSYSIAQICNPTERWINTGYPGTSTNVMTEMNGNLYTVDFHPTIRTVVLMKYDGSAWVVLSHLPYPHAGGNKFKLASYQGQIYLSGAYYPDGSTGEGIARWDSTSNQWLSVGGGLSGDSIGGIYDLEVYQGDLYAAGKFDTIGGVSTKGLAKWNGTRWDSVIDPRLITPDSFWGKIDFWALQTWNNKLAVGGYFGVSGSQYIALWDGSALTGIPGSPFGGVNVMAVYNGDLIMYGGHIRNVGGSPTRHLARWDGSSWHTMGMAVSDFVSVWDMLEYNGELYITGYSASYRVGGGININGVAKWDGNQWHTVTGFKRDDIGWGLKEYKNRLYLHGSLSSSCGAPIDNVVKLCSYPECQPISGHVYQDDNNNCSLDTTEFPMVRQWVNVQPGNYSIPTDSLGNFYTLLDTGTYSVDMSLPTHYSSKCPANGYTVALNTVGGASGLDFGFVPVANITDVNITATATRFRPGFTGRVYLNFGNAGTVLQNGDVTITLDPKMVAGMSSPAFASQTGKTLTWNYTNLAPTQIGRIWLEAYIDTTVQLGDTLCIIANISSTVGTDTTPMNNTDTLKVIVTGSYDPNDKQVSPAGEGITGDIPFDTETLTYTVRFQNTGTDTAFTVLIRDEIDPNLDLGTLSILGASHAYRFEVEEGQKIKWTFDNILLADSNTNEPASHGFVKYQINLKPNLPIGAQIENTAYIYFDFNAPIVTNTTISTLVNPTTAIEPIPQVSHLKVWPNPASDEVHFRLDNQVHNGVLTILDLQGRTVATKKNISEREFRVSLHGLLSGMYMYRLEEKGKVLGVGKIVVK